MAQGPADDDDKNELRKAWTMEMVTNDSDISMSMMNVQESMSEDEKVPIRQSGTLKSFDTVSHVSNNRMTKGGR